MSLNITYEKISELKHAVSQERTIICGAVERLKRLDKRLEELENNLAELIETSADVPEGGDHEKHDSSAGDTGND